MVSAPFWVRLKLLKGVAKHHPLVAMEIASHHDLPLLFGRALRNAGEEGEKIAQEKFESFFWLNSPKENTWGKIMKKYNVPEYILELLD